ncbi:MAG: proline iminopeptidase-family hydrolase [Leptolyngbya sp. SIO3F4]|nr:proline iminopeptidase-family hydrolase [Leptolyngbya sp. SIO3F4]
MKNSSIYVFSLFLLLMSCTQQPSPTLQSGTGFVEVEGGKIWYGIMGQGEKPPLLCLHGGPGGTSRSFYHLSEIAEERPVILFDQLGSGRSDHHQDTSLLKVEKFVEQVKAIQSELQLNEFYLVGSSWGTALALEYYTKYPEGVKGIIFNSPYFSTRIWTKDADILVANLPDSIQVAIQQADADSLFDTESYQAANRFFLSQHGRRNERIKHPYDTVAAYGSSFVYEYMWGPSEFTAKGTLKQYDNIENLKKVAVPTLFTTGEFDEARPETIETLSQLVPGSEFVVIPDAAHYSLNDNRPAVIEAMQAFLEKQEQ